MLFWAHAVDVVIAILVVHCPLLVVLRLSLRISKLPLCSKKQKIRTMTCFIRPGLPRNERMRRIRKEEATRPNEHAPQVINATEVKLDRAVLVSAVA